MTYYVIWNISMKIHQQTYCRGSQACKSFMAQYMSHRQETLNGSHGSTAQFWLTYVNLVHVFLLFNRACRNNNLELFIYAWYHDWRLLCHKSAKLFKMDGVVCSQTPEHRPHTARAPACTWRRCSKCAANHQAIFTSSSWYNTWTNCKLWCSIARNRWMVTNAVRAAIVSNLMIKAGIHLVEDSIKKLKPHRGSRDQEDLQKTIQTFEATMNPFTIGSDPNLYCISSGKKVSEDIKEDLLNMQSNGHQWAEEFRLSCSADPERFERPIPKRKVKNFASAAAKWRAPPKMKIKELQCSRYLFGRLLILSTMSCLDLGYVFTYPLIPVPLPLAHIDGSLNKTN